MRERIIYFPILQFPKQLQCRGKIVKEKQSLKENPIGYYRPASLLIQVQAMGQTR